MLDWQKIDAELSAKLDKAHVKPPSKFGPKGDYLEGWHVIAEANRIFGFNGWSYDLVAVKCVAENPRKIGREAKDGFGVTYTAQVRVTVEGINREDVGAGHGYDVDCGLAHESAIKEAVTDALKRALRTFGNPFGLALYDKSRENVEDTSRKDAGRFSKPINDKAMQEPSPLEIFINHMDKARDLAELQQIWSAHPGQQAFPGAIAAKDRNKARLQVAA